jgi:hypothetical protein
VIYLAVVPIFCRGSVEVDNSLPDKFKRPAIVTINGMVIGDAEVYRKGPASDGLESPVEVRGTIPIYTTGGLVGAVEIAKQSTIEIQGCGMVGQVHNAAIEVGEIATIIDLHSGDSYVGKRCRSVIGYVRAKARRYLEIGPDRYQQHDFFHQPNLSMSESDLAIIHTAIVQLANGIGFDSDSPLYHLGSKAIHLLMPIFHFRFDQMVSNRIKHGFIDEISATHVVSNSSVTFFSISSMPGLNHRKIHLISSA